MLTKVLLVASPLKARPKLWDTNSPMMANTNHFECLLGILIYLIITCPYITMLLVFLFSSCRNLTWCNGRVHLGFFHISSMPLANDIYWGHDHLYIGAYFNNRYARDDHLCIEAYFDELKSYHLLKYSFQ